MKVKYHYAEIILDLEDWERIIRSKGIDEISDVLVVKDEEYSIIGDQDQTEKVKNKSIKLYHTPNSNLDGIYQLIEYKFVETDSGEISIFIKGIKKEKNKVEIIKEGGEDYQSNYNHLSPLNSNSSCANSSCFMNLWGIFSIIGFIVLITLLLGLFNGESLNSIQQSLPGCNNCLDNVISIFESEDIPEEIIDEEETRNINPNKEPHKYLKYAGIEQSKKLDLSIIWNTRNDIDLIGVDPDGELLWKNNRIVSFGIMDKSSNDSQFDEFGKYSEDLSIRLADSIAIEHLYIPEGTILKKGNYRFYVLSSDKRENCLKNDIVYLRMIHNNKEKLLTKKIPNSVNNRCLGEINFKQIYTYERLEFYKENKAAELLFQLEVN